MGWAGIATQLTGAGVNAIAASSAAAGQKSKLESAASAELLNAQMYESAAQQELRRGIGEQQAVQRRTANLKADQKVALAANGIDLGSGSAVNILTTTDYMGELDANMTHANSVRSAFGLRRQAQTSKNQADAFKSSANGIDPGMAGFTSLLSDASTVASSWYSAKKAGAVNSPFAISNGDYMQYGNGPTSMMGGARQTKLG